SWHGGCNQVLIPALVWGTDTLRRPPMTNFLNRAEEALGTIVTFAVPAFVTVAMLAFTVRLI
ncbi:MAG: hypothetical protein JWM77_108, partial [Rhodospirillales bacterium]|nr:hypothetical protein [Rhodospirillales bacterium]